MLRQDAQEAKKWVHVGVGGRGLAVMYQWFTWTSIRIPHTNKSQHRNKSLLEKHQEKVTREEKAVKRARAGKPPERVPWSRCVYDGWVVGWH